jgi:hypothetical protein
MSQVWCRLENRFGDKDNSSPPSDAELQVAASEVLDEKGLRRDIPSLLEGDLEEHPNAWIEAGSDGGPLVVLDLYRGVRFEYIVYADSDMNAEIFRGNLHGVSIAQAVALWAALRDGRIEEIQAAFR